MTRHDAPLAVDGRLRIGSPTDDFELNARGQSLELTGPSIGSFLRLRKQARNTSTPPWLSSLTSVARDRADLDLRCVCRGRTIASGRLGDGAFRLRPHFGAIVRAALRF